MRCEYHGYSGKLCSGQNDYIPEITVPAAARNAGHREMKGDEKLKGKYSAWDACRLAGLYIVLYFVSAVLFIALFHTPLFRNIDVLMYRGTVFVVLSAVAAALLLLAVRRISGWDFISMHDVVLLLCGCCCVNMVFFTLVPVTVERSVSVFMLSYMDENEGKAFTEDEIKEIFTEKYVNDFGAFEKRFHEQLVTGTITLNEDGAYGITERPLSPQQSWGE